MITFLHPCINGLPFTSLQPTYCTFSGGSIYAFYQGFTICGSDGCITNYSPVTVYASVACCLDTGIAQLIVATFRGQQNDELFKCDIIAFNYDSVDDELSFPGVIIDGEVCRKAYVIPMSQYQSALLAIDSPVSSQGFTMQQTQFYDFENVCPCQPPSGGCPTGYVFNTTTCQCEFNIQCPAGFTVDPVYGCVRDTSTNPAPDPIPTEGDYYSLEAVLVCDTTAYQGSGYLLQPCNTPISTLTQVEEAAELITGARLISLINDASYQYTTQANHYSECRGPNYTQEGAVLNTLSYSPYPTIPMEGNAGLSVVSQSSVWYQSCFTVNANGGIIDETYVPAASTFTTTIEVAPAGTNFYYPVLISPTPKATYPPPPACTVMLCYYLNITLTAPSVAIVLTGTIKDSTGEVIANLSYTIQATVPPYTFQYKIYCVDVTNASNLELFGYALISVAADLLVSALYDATLELVAPGGVFLSDLLNFSISTQVTNTCTGS